MQCKDIPDRPILEYLAKYTHEYKWAMRWDLGNFPCVLRAMPPDVPEKLALAKMGQLIRRKLVNGCTCGCRGDFYIADKGRAWLKSQNETAE